MGIDYTVSNALLHALSYVNKKRAVTLGRQGDTCTGWDGTFFNKIWVPI
jgi:hypothetical protein